MSSTLKLSLMIFHLAIVMIMPISGCVSYSSPSGKLEVADIQYRQGYCRSSLISYFQSFGKSVDVGDYQTARTAISRVEERAGNCIFGTAGYESSTGIIGNATSVLSRMESIPELKYDSYNFAIWLTDFSESKLTKNINELNSLINKIALENNDSNLSRKIGMATSPENIEKNSRDAISNAMSGRSVEETHDEASQAISSIGNLLGVAGIATERSATQIATLGAAMQTATGNPEKNTTQATNTLGIVSKQQKVCGKITSQDSASKVCSCEGGRPEQLRKPSSTLIQCTKPDNRESWGCSFFTDGSRHQCAVK